MYRPVVPSIYPVTASLCRIQDSKKLLQLQYYKVVETNVVEKYTEIRRFAEKNALDKIEDT